MHNKDSCVNELVMGFSRVTIFVVIVGIKTSFLIAFMVLFVNVFFNLYLFMLHRFHRLRLTELRS
jgi:hypothetical protein